MSTFEERQIVFAELAQRTNTTLSLADAALDEIIRLRAEHTRLKEHDNDVIERCAVLCEKSDRYRGDYFAEKLRALKQ